MDDIIKDIRFRLRKAMNGIVSASMRQKGVHYKLNFGVSIPEIRNIAQSYEPNEELAKWLWNEDVREHKILATLLYPREAFKEEMAETWVGDICYQEIAEQYCVNLLQYLPFSNKLAERWIGDEREFVKVCGFLLSARIYAKGGAILSSDNLLAEAKKVMDQGISSPQRAALLALKRYGRQSIKEAQEVLGYINEYQTAGSEEKLEFFNDLKFEFEYYN